MVVCYLHGQTGRFTVWANGKQNSRLVNLVPESRLPFVQITSIHPKTAAKAWNWYERRLWRNGTRISVWNIPTVETGLPFQTFRCSRKFSTETTWQVVFHLLSNRIFGKLFVRGKQPVCVCVRVFFQVACYSCRIKMTGKPKVCPDKWWSSWSDRWPAAILSSAITFHPNIGWKLSVVSQAVIVN